MASVRVVGSGFGLLGMRERAASVHGALIARDEDGRFTIEAVLPEHRDRTGDGAIS